MTTELFIPLSVALSVHLAVAHFRERQVGGIVKGKFSRIISAAILFGAAVCLAPSSVRAQAPGTGAITGKISDPSGALVPQASVNVVNEETGLARTATLMSDGQFRAPLL